MFSVTWLAEDVTEPTYLSKCLGLEHVVPAIVVYGLVSRVSALHRANVMTPFLLGRNFARKNAMIMTM